MTHFTHPATARASRGATCVRCSRSHHKPEAFEFWHLPYWLVLRRPWRCRHCEYFWLRPLWHRQ